MIQAGRPPAGRDFAGRAAGVASAPRKSGKLGRSHSGVHPRLIDKRVSTCREAVARVFDGATVMLGGFGNAGMPGQLIEALREQGARNLTIISNGAGTGPFALGLLFEAGRRRAHLDPLSPPSAAEFFGSFLAWQ